jgi:hypothetical protein
MGIFIQALLEKTTERIILRGEVKHVSGSGSSSDLEENKTVG